MKRHIIFSVFAVLMLALVHAASLAAKGGGDGIEIAAILVCNDESPALEFRISNGWEEDVKVIKNWLPWNRSPWFEITIDGVKRASLSSLSKYREDRVVVLQSGKYLSGSVKISRLFPSIEVSEPTLIKWKMIGAPFRSFFSGSLEGSVELRANHCAPLLSVSNVN